MIFSKDKIPGDAVVFGSGGREHAIATGLKPWFERVFVLPGNPGMEQDVEIVKLDLSFSDPVIEFLKSLNNPLIVIGPEALLIDGWSDLLRKNGFLVFGPDSAAAKLESSKEFSKTFMKKYGIPTADFTVCRSSKESERALRLSKAPYVVKADGLAAGKGVFITHHREEARLNCVQLLNGSLGEAGKTVIIEDNVSGWEMSVFAVTDGKNYLILPPVQDHKRAFDGDTGPNTGGMGAYLPVPNASQDLMQEIDKTIIKPTVNGMLAEGIPYIGVIFFGLMIDDENKPYLLEYNVRFGDPEAQVLFSAVKCNWGAILKNCAVGNIGITGTPELPAVPTATVVVASGGYPKDYETGHAIAGIETVRQLPDTSICSAGIGVKNEEYVTAGGRVLSVTASDSSLKGAINKAYAGIKHIRFKDMHYRKDIGSRTE